MSFNEHNYLTLGEIHSLSGGALFRLTSYLRYLLSKGYFHSVALLPSWSSAYHCYHSICWIDVNLHLGDALLWRLCRLNLRREGNWRNNITTHVKPARVENRSSGVLVFYLIFGTMQQLITGTSTIFKNEKMKKMNPREQNDWLTTLNMAKIY